MKLKIIVKMRKMDSFKDNMLITMMMSVKTGKVRKMKIGQEDWENED